MRKKGEVQPKVDLKSEWTFILGTGGRKPRMAGPRMCTQVHLHVLQDAQTKSYSNKSMHSLVYRLTVHHSFL